MTGIARRLADATALDEERARSVIACTALTLCAVLAGLLFHTAGLLTVLVLGQLWLFWNRATLADLVEEARADVDELGDGHRAVVAHLTGREAGPSGRHADGAPQTYRGPSTVRALPAP